MRIFLSYRRSDVGGYAGRLADTLVQRLGAKNVFQDVTNIAGGRDFTAAIHNALAGCDAALAVIGPGWLTASTPEGNPRLFEGDDYVRVELATVLQRDLPVVPVLVGGTSLPVPADLPEDLRSLLGRQAIVLRDETWHQDVEALLRSLRGEPAAGRPANRRRTTIIIGLVALAVVVAVVFWRPWATISPRIGGGSASPDLAACPDTTGTAWTALTLNASPSGRVQLTGTGGELGFTVRAASWRPLGSGSWQVVVNTDMENLTPENSTHASYRYDYLVVASRTFKPTCFDTPQPRVIPKTIGPGRIGYVVTCQPKGLVEFVVSGNKGEARIPVTNDLAPSQC